MPRARKHKHDDVVLTFTSTKRWSREACVKHFSYEQQDTLDNITADLGLTEGKSSRERRILTTMKQRLTEYSFPQFLHDYLTDENFTAWVETDSGDPDHIDDFIGDMYSELYDDLERETRKRGAAQWCPNCMSYLGRHKCAE